MWGSEVKLYEKEIVEHLWQSSKAVYGDDCLAIKEMPIYSHRNRADLLVVTRTEVHGIEVKSAKDTLKRLPKQILGYDSTCNLSILVCAERHVQPALGMLPAYWGVSVFEGTTRKLVREPVLRSSPSIEKHQLDLLHSSELLKIARALKLDFDQHSKGRIIANLQRSITPSAPSMLFSAIKSRGNWRLKNAMNDLREYKDDKRLPKTTALLQLLESHIEKAKAFRM